MNPRTPIQALVFLALSSVTCLADGMFEPLPLPASFFPGAVWLSADGSAMCGWNNFYYSPSTGYRYATSGTMSNLSGDGTTVIGTDNTDGTEVASTWTPDGGWVALDALPGGEACGSSISSGYALSGDATVAVGLAWVPNCRAEAFRWTAGGGTVGLGHTEGVSSRATDLSDDGSTAVGFDEHPQYGNRRPALWNGDVAGPQLFAGEDVAGEAAAVSSDGSRVCGTVNSFAFYYDTTVGLVDIGALEGETWGSTATGIADDGTVVGFSGDPWFSFPSAFIWTRAGGITSLATHLVALGVDVAGYYLYTATSISADGSTIAGTAIDPTGMWFVPYVVHLPSDNAPVAGIDGSTRLEMGLSVSPNPFTAETQVSFELARAQTARLTVIDLGGRELVTLGEGAFHAGSQSIRWDGRDAGGHSVAAGTYFLRMESEEGVHTRKVSLTR